MISGMHPSYTLCNVVWLVVYGWGGGVAFPHSKCQPTVCHCWINMLTLYKPVRNLRSSHDQTQLVVPRFNLSLSGQCFSIYAPKVWNELPSSIREAPSVAAFKNQLKSFKTHFFCKL